MMVCKSHKGPLKLYEPICVSLENSVLSQNLQTSFRNLQTHQQITVAKRFWALRRGAYITLVAVLQALLFFLGQMGWEREAPEGIQPTSSRAAISPASAGSSDLEVPLPRAYLVCAAHTLGSRGHAAVHPCLQSLFA